MQRLFSMILCSIILFFCIDTAASANIAPLKLKSDGVEPFDNPGVRIESAEITVSPDSSGFKFNCNYTIKGLQDINSLMIGIPGDLGYTLEAGYIENMNVSINGRPVKYSVYNTTKDLSETWKNHNSPINFKWHTFTIPIKKDAIVNISVAYNTSWRIFEQNKNSPYYIIPFLISTDKLFGNSIGSYKIKYINDDYISIPDVKVMINSMLEPNIISQAILSPVSTDSQVLWEFKNPKDFQDFRLIALSFKKLSTDLAKDIAAESSPLDQSIKWALLNSNYDKLASIFEDVAKKSTPANLNDNSLATAAYLSSEFYFRQKNYSKALEMLSLPGETNLWPRSIKYQYIHCASLKESQNYNQLLDELKKLSQQKDYVLASNYANNQIGPVMELIRKQRTERAEKKAERPVVMQVPEKKPEPEKDSTVEYLAPALGAILLMILFSVYKKIHKI